MRKFIVAGLATAMMAASAITPASAQAISAGASAIQSAAPSNVSEVRHHRYNRRYYSHRRYHRDRGGNAVAAGVAGLAVGAIVGSALTAQQQPRYYAPGPVYAGGNDWHAYCASKYRSYDVRTGTYLGYDGYRRPCR